MKKLNVLSMVFTLTLVLANHASAGEIWIPGPPPPTASSASIRGEIGLPRDGNPQGSPSESAAVVALNLLKGVLLVF
jgi:hypothetical protein